MQQLQSYVICEWTKTVNRILMPAKAFSWLPCENNRCSYKKVKQKISKTLGQQWVAPKIMGWKENPFFFFCFKENLLWLRKCPIYDLFCFIMNTGAYLTCWGSLQKFQLFKLTHILQLILHCTYIYTFYNKINHAWHAH
jgi:hypothetical protein